MFLSYKGRFNVCKMSARNSEGKEGRGEKADARGRVPLPLWCSCLQEKGRPRFGGTIPAEPGTIAKTLYVRFPVLAFRLGPAPMHWRDIHPHGLLWAGCSLWAEPGVGWGRGASSPEDTYSLGQWDEHLGISYLGVHTVWSTVASLSGVGPRSSRSAKLWGACKAIRTSVCRPRRGFVWSNFTVLYYVIFTNILDLLSWFYNEKINH